MELCHNIVCTQYAMLCRVQCGAVLSIEDCKDQDQWDCVLMKCKLRRIEIDRATQLHKRYDKVR